MFGCGWPLAVERRRTLGGEAVGHVEGLATTRFRKCTHEGFQGCFTMSCLMISGDFRLALIPFV